MKLDFILLAEDALVADRKLYIHGGGVKRIDLPGVPWVAHLAIAAGFTAELSEAGGRHELGVKLIQPNGEESTTFPPAPIAIPVEVEDDWEEIGVATSLNYSPLVILQEGWYVFRLTLDGDHLADLRLRVVAKQKR